jgi:hypothetical protein
MSAQFEKKLFLQSGIELLNPASTQSLYRLNYTDPHILSYMVGIAYRED